MVCGKQIASCKKVGELGDTIYPPPTRSPRCVTCGRVIEGKLKGIYCLGPDERKWWVCQECWQKAWR